MTAVATDIAAAPCAECGGPKPRGQGRKLCDGCRPLVATRQRARHNRGYYERNRARILEQNRAWAEANPAAAAAIKRHHYERDVVSGERQTRNLARYGLTIADYDAMLVAQDGTCAICDGVDQRRRLSVDHDHTTGEVRGLLCSGCNGALLGKMEDDPERIEARAAELAHRAECLRRAAEYLRNPPAREVVR